MVSVVVHKLQKTLVNALMKSEEYRTTYISLCSHSIKWSNIENHFQSQKWDEKKNRMNRWCDAKKCLQRDAAARHEAWVAVDCAVYSQMIPRDDEWRAQFLAGAPQSEYFSIGIVIIIVLPFSSHTWVISTNFPFSNISHHNRNFNFNMNDVLSLSLSLRRNMGQFAANRSTFSLWLDEIWWTSEKGRGN